METTTLKETKILSKYFGEKDSHTLEFYLSHGGYEVAKKVLAEKTAEEAPRPAPFAGC